MTELSNRIAAECGNGRFAALDTAISDGLQLISSDMLKGLDPQVVATVTAPYLDVMGEHIGRWAAELTQRPLQPVVESTALSLDGFRGIWRQLASGSSGWCEAGQWTPELPDPAGVLESHLQLAQAAIDRRWPPHVG